MFGFGRKKLKQSADGQPSEGEESAEAKGGLFKRLFGAREGEDLGWVPGLGPLPEAGGAPEPDAEPAPLAEAGAGAPAEAVAEVAVEGGASAPAAAPEREPELGPEPVPEPVPELAPEPPAPVAAEPAAGAPLVSAPPASEVAPAPFVTPVEPARSPAASPAAAPAAPESGPGPAAVGAASPAPIPEPAPAPLPDAAPAGSSEAPAPKAGLFKRLFHRADEAGVPAAEADSASAPPAAPLTPPPAAPRATPRLIEVRDQPVDWESPEVRRGLFGRLRERLTRSRTQLGSGLGTLFLGRKKIDDELMEELETLLVTADVGMEATARVIGDLTRRVKRKTLADPQALLAALKEELRGILTAAAAPVRQAAPDRPQVILMVGVNGAGKTTTIGKLARVLQAEGNSVMLAAGDTFRAAAVEQLQTWGERNRVPVIAQKGGADSASVIFDALQAATARGVDVLIADTAGRLHTKANLMDELTKIARVMKKLDPQAPHEVLLVIDATTGQNGLNQAVQFHQAVPLTGIALTKLDGTAKGGIVFAIADKLKVPIRFIGVGEAIEDLRPFDADEFLDALLGQ